MQHEEDQGEVESVLNDEVGQRKQAGTTRTRLNWRAYFLDQLPTQGILTGDGRLLTCKLYVFYIAYLSSSSSHKELSNLHGPIMTLLSDVGERISLWLHDVIYSMPSPDNLTDVTSTQFDDATGKTKLSDLIDEPGEPKALAGGIGPLSFAGSGYGVMLVLTVSCRRPPLLLSMAEHPGHTVESHSQHCP